MVEFIEEVFFIIASSWRVYNSDVIIKALTKVFLIFSSIFCSEITNLKQIQPKDLEWMASKVIIGTVKFIKYEYKFYSVSAGKILNKSLQNLTVLHIWI